MLKAFQRVLACLENQKRMMVTVKQAYSKMLTIADPVGICRTLFYQTVVFNNGQVLHVRSEITTTYKHKFLGEYESQILDSRLSYYETKLSEVLTFILYLKEYPKNLAQKIDPTGN